MYFLLVYRPYHISQRDIFTTIFTVTLFKIAKIWKQLKSSLMDELKKYVIYRQIQGNIIQSHKIRKSVHF